MKVWEKLIGIRTVAKRVKFIYVPYKKAKIAYISKKKRKTLHDNGVKVINQVERVLCDYGMAYFADYGTLLGIIRDRNFIAWDIDMDYGIEITNYFDWGSFEEYLDKNGFKKIREFKYENKIREQTYQFMNVDVDFFGKYDSQIECRTYLFYKLEGYNYESEFDYHACYKKYSPINGTEKIPFLDTYVTVPSNYEEYLESVYSSNWRIPDPNATGEPDKTLLDKMGRGFFYVR